LKNEELTLAILRHAESIRTQKSLAENLGYSVGKINYILKALIAKGLIKAENFATSSNKKQYRYLLTREGIKEKVALTEKFIARKKREYEELMVELELIKKDEL
jgi:EPS-associated MarR family transcriptional regulator